MKRLFSKFSSKNDRADIVHTRTQMYREYIDSRRNVLLSLMRECRSNEEKGMKVIREEGHFSEFKVFVDLCLVHFIDSMNWRYQAYSSPISEIFTSSDEAMAMLFFENYLDDYFVMHNSKEKVTRKTSTPKYTKTKDEKDRFHGWHIKGIKRYNELLKYVKSVRNSDLGRSMEKELQEYYKKFCNREDKYSDGGHDIDEEIEDSDEDGNVDIDAIDDWEEV